MWSIKLICAVLFIAVVVHATSPPLIYPERPGYCRIREVYIKEGEEGPGPIADCRMVKCNNATPGKVDISGVGCAAVQPAEGCHLSDYDYTSQYPDCCPKSVCN